MTDLEVYAVAFALATVLGVTIILGVVYCVRAAGRRLRARYHRHGTPVIPGQRPSHLAEDTPAQAAYREKLRRRQREREQREHQWPVTDAELRRLESDVVAAAIAITRGQANGDVP